MLRQRKNPRHVAALTDVHISVSTAHTKPPRPAKSFQFLPALKAFQYKPIYMQDLAHLVMGFQLCLTEEAAPYNFHQSSPIREVHTFMKAQMAGHSLLIKPSFY